MGWWGEQKELQRLRERIESLEAENALYVRMLNGVVWPDPTECADCGQPVSRAFGSPVVLCADCAGPAGPLRSPDERAVAVAAGRRSVNLDRAMERHGR